MSDTRPTPGPWRAGFYSSILGLPVMAQPDPTENTIVVATLVGDRDECEANARLVAAAPDLLAALDELVCAVAVPEVHNHDPIVLAALAKARAAISRATQEK